MTELLLPSLIVLFAATMQACTGFGFSILATPFLLLFFPAHTAIQLNILLSIAISVLMIPEINHELDRALLRRMVVGSALGAPLGAMLFVMFDVRVLKLVISVITLALTVLLAFELRFAQTGRRDVAAGALSGAFTTSLGMPGLPLLLYFSGTEVEQQRLRSTVLAFFLGIYVAALVLQALFGVSEMQTWLTALLLLPATYAGVMAGRMLCRRINPAAFRAMTFAILISTGGYLLYSSI
jgi:uncharacterized membrane protein YfcA